MSKSREKRLRRRAKHWPWYTIVLFGPSGVGKTTLSATAPKPIFLDSNQGLLSIEGRPGFEHVESRPVFGSEDLEKHYNRFRGLDKPSYKGKFETIVVDHLDDVQQLTLAEFTIKAAERDSRRGDDPAQREWGLMANRLRRQIRQYKRLPAHKIFIVSTGIDKITGQAIPNIAGQLREQLPYFADFIFYMGYGKKGRRYLRIRPDEQYLAKCRAWWIKENKLPVPDDTTTMMSDLLARIAAGPSVSTSKRRIKEK